MPIYILCLSVMMFVCLCPINVRRGEPIKTPGKVYELSNEKNLPPTKFDFNKNFENPRDFFNKIHEVFSFCFTIYTKVKVFTMR